MFKTTKDCEGLKECIKICPTDAIRLVDNKAFSCITCGACERSCPNKAIFKNKYGGYIVDRAKCNGCGVCEKICPIDNIRIEDGVVKGICSQCGICADTCPNHARRDAADSVKSKQKKFYESANQNEKPVEQYEAERKNIITDCDNCILCRRCESSCPTNAIQLKIDQENVCTNCKICEDICPVDAINDNVIDKSKCTFCLECYKVCPNNAVEMNGFKLNIVKPETKITGSIVSCLNCGLCVSVCDKGSMFMVAGKLRANPDICSKCNDKKCIDACPVGTLKESDYKEIGLEGYCVSCELCVTECQYNARKSETVSWDGKVSNDCIYCGICSEVCPVDAITIKRGSTEGAIEVDLEKCILCENCGIHCPKDAIPKTTMRKMNISGGFIAIEDKLCMNCYLCEKTCPENAIFQNSDGTVDVDISKCIYCGGCSNICPARAIIFERNFEELS